MTTLIIVAHGSKLESSNMEVIELVKNIKKENNSLHITYAFLELSKPSLLEEIEEQIKTGAKEIKVFPYFLAAGKHVKSDIPNIIEQSRVHYPNIKFELLPHLGICKGISSLILSNILDKKDI
ncbi:hypothetical protein CRU99_06020 [Malaciobacter mytili]|uniref:sirohydrochlorin chelatase n=1 Tax=Malaciobacter mytili TaxID=603050 RepID=UPI00100C2B33|nr:CbiX/SirB N-terminal domain-containing protein [Malaciobacter mytili]RXI43978.1 hypothetical protein CRU99_06020 [Malaciobacter mytili]